MAVVLEVTVETRLVTKRLHAQLVNQALRAAADNHLDNVMPGHFVFGAGARYGYKKRSKGYMISKARKFGHQLPLVRTGQLRDQLRKNSRVTATQYKSTVYLFSYFPLNDDRRKELEAMDTTDRQAAVKVANQYYATEAAKPENRPKRKLRIT